MTDYIRLYFEVGTHTLPLDRLGMTWPPPEYIYIEEGGKIREARKRDPDAYKLRRTSMSQISDDDAAKMTGIARGAEYHYLSDLPPGVLGP